MNKQARELYYYFGRNDAHDYVATPVGNAVIAGVTGAGKSTLLQSVLIRFIQECHPNDVKILIDDCKGLDLRIWSELPEGKVIPQIDSVILYNGSSEGNCKQFLDRFNSIYEEAKCRYQACANNRLSHYSDIEDVTSYKTIIYIVDEYQVFFEKFYDELNEKLSYILKTSYLTGIYVMLSSQSYKNAISRDLLVNFNIGICTPRVPEEVSNIILGNNCASMDGDRHGSIFIRCGNKMPIKLYVPFYPDTWIRKFIGYYSVRKGL